MWPKPASSLPLWWNPSASRNLLRFHSPVRSPPELAHALLTPLLPLTQQLTCPPVPNKRPAQRRSNRMRPSSVHKQRKALFFDHRMGRWELVLQSTRSPNRPDWGCFRGRGRGSRQQRRRSCCSRPPPPISVPGAASLQATARHLELSARERTFCVAP